MKIEHVPDRNEIFVRLEDIDEARAIISGLDSDRNHPARSTLYLGLLQALSEKPAYWRGLAAFANVVREDEYSTNPRPKYRPGAV